MLIFTYGMLMEDSLMQEICHDAENLGPVSLGGWRLGFRQFACIEAAQSSDKVYGVLWEVPEDCVAMLDAVEGVPDHYQRVKLTGSGSWKNLPAGIDADSIQLYYMVGGRNGAPSRSYLEILVDAAQSYPRTAAAHLNEIRQAVIRSRR